MRLLLSIILFIAIFSIPFYLVSAEVSFITSIGLIEVWPFSSDFMWLIFMLIQYVLIFVLVMKIISIINMPQRKKELEKLYENLEENKSTIKIQMEEARLPRIKIVPNPVKKDLSKIASKFGGSPYWPKGKKYPAAKSGSPLLCIAQFNLKDLPKNSLLPTKGLLQFFICVDDYTMGMESNDFRIVYHKNFSLDDTEEDLPDLADQRKSDWNPVNGIFKLEFAEQEEVYPNSGTQIFDEIVGKELAEAYYSEYEPKITEYLDSNFSVGTWEESSQIGGYPTPVQYDRMGNSQILLFQMFSYFGTSAEMKIADISWGDAGAAYFYIKEDDLRKLDFSNVVAYWDCH